MPLIKIIIRARCFLKEQNAQKLILNSYRYSGGGDMHSIVDGAYVLR